MVLLCVSAFTAECVCADEGKVAQCLSSTACLSAADWCTGQSHVLRDGSTGRTASTITPLFIHTLSICQREREREREDQAWSRAGHVITARNKKCWVSPSFDSIWQNLYKCSLLTDSQTTGLLQSTRTIHTVTNTSVKHSQNCSASGSIRSVVFLWFSLDSSLLPTSTFLLVSLSLSVFQLYILHLVDKENIKVSVCLQSGCVICDVCFFIFVR